LERIMTVVMETPTAVPEPEEAMLPDKPPVPEVEEDNVVPGEEPVPAEEFQSPEEAAANPETDNTEHEA
jgi:hypothetical protein